MGKIREYLKGDEETGVSKNILLMMRNRHAYLPAIHRFIRSNSGLSANHIFDSITLDYNYWKAALDQLEVVTSSDEKGKRFEELAQYFIRTIPGIKITDVRAKRGRAEVDIYCCNVSYDSWLWKLGALILIECKNRKNKVLKELEEVGEDKGAYDLIREKIEYFERIMEQNVCVSYKSVMLLKLNEL
ncbi:hypothetical protein J2S00_003401 [Caldalkalibacillus uzonensis]|uniref:Uncharacterized protein n=1 Tax=Caldalkalibacillus uzonensis TaxID=353224 RepID=A0ABU0CXP5_9BACI|nr:hypothetical protein [Caldalkalibacillus uzonensis]MDQ0340577.1 hypothetical protein [Caldalkalibacillus uzonensis]